MKSILVTGGCGYIGSHTVLELLNKNYDVVVVDNFSNSSFESIRRVQKITGYRQRGRGTGISPSRRHHQSLLRIGEGAGYA